MPYSYFFIWAWLLEIFSSYSSYMEKSMTVYTPAQTGPKTAEGKAASSRNATKLGVYSNSLMPGESEQELQDLNNSLRETFEVDDGMCEMQIRTI